MCVFKLHDVVAKIGVQDSFFRRGKEKEEHTDGSCAGIFFPFNHWHGKEKTRGR
jgi:hypothetical protein